MKLSSFPQSSDLDSMPTVDTPVDRRRFMQLLGAGIVGASLGISDSVLANSKEQNEAVEVPERHWRLESPHGPIHVWHPAYSGKLDETVVYAHGDNNNADKVWSDKYKMRDQFEKSGRKALYIIPSVPPGPGPRPKGEISNWDQNLEGLTDFVQTETGLSVPSHITAMGHSAGYRSIQSWLEDERIENIILIDSFYGYFSRFRDWLKKEGHCMALVSANPEKSQSTKEWGEPFAEKLSKRHEVQFFDHMPKKLKGKMPKLVYINTLFHHHLMPMGNRVIPKVLQFFKKSKNIG